MTATDIQEKFLPLNRNRRTKDGVANPVLKSDSGRRFVMGRKGLGKLAAFGTARKVTIWTKKRGDNYSTTFSMDFEDIKKAKDIADVTFSPTYTPESDVEKSGTRITLSHLFCDSMKSKKDLILATFVDNFFGIDSKDFKIIINDDQVVAPDVHYEFFHPNANGSLGEIPIIVDEAEIAKIQYTVKFRARETDARADDDKRIRGPLITKQRGARIYCNKRLAAGPTMFDLPTGMHNFHSQSYMECIVHADDLDRHNVDLVNTNRTDLRRDNDVVDQLVKTLEEVMKTALREHAKFRDKMAGDAINNDPFSQGVLKTIDCLPHKTKGAARRILLAIAKSDGIKSERYKEFAPLLIQSMNAGEVLIRLSELSADPTTIIELAENLTALSEMEDKDVLKLYRGRRSGINALKTLIEKGDEIGRAGPKFENELQAVLKNNPWLVNPEYSRHLTSDEPMADVLQRLDKALGVDSSAPEPRENDKKRPDLVFLIADAFAPNQVSIVELKSPNIPLDSTHLNQLKGYMGQTKRHLRSMLNREVAVKGHLIGTLPPQDTSAQDCMTLIDMLAERGSDAAWEVISLGQMLERARKIHLDAIVALEAEEKAEVSAEITSTAKPEPSPATTA